MDEAEQRRYWRLRWLSSLQAFTDTETQRSRWLDPAERNPHFSFVECMCCYFDDAYLGEECAYEKRLSRGHVSADEAAAVANFHSLADCYENPRGDDWDNEAVLTDPKWLKVVEAAQRAQERLLQLLTDDAERIVLTRPIHWEVRDGIFHGDYPTSHIVPSS